MDWYESLDRFSSAAGRIVALGATDAGKSTWIRAVAARHSGRVAVVSGDPGQAIAGAPGLLAAIAPFDPGRPAAVQAPAAVYFVGYPRPSDRPAQTIEGLRRLVARVERDCDAVLVDTDGYVRGAGGRDHKRLLLGALAPCAAVFLGADAELAPLRAWAQGRIDVESWFTDAAVERRARSAGERRDSRRASSRDWLAADERRLVCLERALVLSAGTGLGRPLDRRTRAAMAEPLGLEPLHAELAGRTLELLVDHGVDPEGRQRVRAESGGYGLRVHDVRDWLGCRIGDFGPDGLSAGMGLVDGWQRDPPALAVRGRFLRAPGSVWQLGDRPA